jgi:GUN4-like
MVHLKYLTWGVVVALALAHLSARLSAQATDHIPPSAAPIGPVQASAPNATPPSPPLDTATLAQFLDQHDWAAASEETRRLVFEAVERRDAVTIGHDWLPDRALARITCADLHQLDRLWVARSQGQYGFTVQQRLWGQALTYDHLKQDPAHWASFTKHLGWQSAALKVAADTANVGPSGATEAHPQGAWPRPIQATADFDNQPIGPDSETFIGSTLLDRVAQCQFQ